MALSTENGYYVLRLTVNGKRVRVRLGTNNDRKALAIEQHVAHLQAATAGVALPTSTITWLEKIDDQLHDRLARAGLVAPRVGLTLGELLDRHLESRKADSKIASRIAWGQAARDLRQHFGDDRHIRSIGSADAQRFREWMLTRPQLHRKGQFPEATATLSKTTAHKRLNFCRSFFAAALRYGLVTSNPFAEVRIMPGNPRERQHYVSLETTKALIEAAPSAHWRLLIGLARYAGLRVPSEPLSLKWEHVNAEKGTICVVSPKTEHHPGQDQRIVPLFPELRPLLVECDELADVGDVFVFPESWRLRAQGPRGWAGCNLRTTLEKIIIRAGEKPWPRLWTNMRSSAATDLIARFPVADATGWLGHNAAIAAKHYWQSRPEVLAEAAGLFTGPGPDRNPDQQARQMGRDGSQDSEHVRRKETTYDASCSPTTKKLERKGVEPSTSALRTQRSPN